MTTAHDSEPHKTEAEYRWQAACVACREACQAAIAHCLQERGDAEDAAHVRLMRECAARCETAVAASAGDGDVTAALAAACESAAEVARALTDLPGGDPKLESCIQACYDCARSCTEMAAKDVPYDKSVADTFPASDPIAH